MSRALLRRLRLHVHLTERRQDKDSQSRAARSRHALLQEKRATKIIAEYSYEVRQSKAPSVYHRPASRHDGAHSLNAFCTINR